MPKKRKKPDEPNNEPEMWINPNSSFRGARGDRAWENRSGGIPNNSRLLELADLALGLKKPQTKKKKAATGIHSNEKKTEPYSKP